MKEKKGKARRHTSSIDIEWKPIQECVTDQFNKEESKRIRDNALERKKGEWA